MLCPAELRGRRTGYPRRCPRPVPPNRSDVGSHRRSDAGSHVGVDGPTVGNPWATGIDGGPADGPCRAVVPPSDRVATSGRGALRAAGTVGQPADTTRSTGPAGTGGTLRTAATALAAHPTGAASAATDHRTAHLDLARAGRDQSDRRTTG